MRSLAFGLTTLVALGATSCTPTPERKVPDPVVLEPTEVPAKVLGADRVGSGIEYTISFEDAAHHYLKVRAVFPAEPNAEVELGMAVWTPGSYLVREYARNLEDLRIVDADGTALSVTKSRKNRWKVLAGNTPGIVAEYRLYCRELSVRTNFVDADSAIINGAPTFLTLFGSTGLPHRVRLELPKSFRPAVSALRSETTNEFHADNYDELVDSPIIAGREVAIGEFAIEGIRHRLVHLGDSSAWDLQEALTDVEQLTRAGLRFWGVMPYQHYDFLNAILGGRGGLEHLDSTLMLSKALGTQISADYRDWLGLVAHEFFHTWNIKRLRPKALGPFDYENENYTRSLWVAEGITSYYDDLLLRRAGLLDEEQYLDRLSDQIASLQTTPGRLVQPLSEASYDAWIKYYRRDENSGNTSISYYTKGAVVAFLLDMRIRAGSGGKRSLDDLMRQLYKRYSGTTGYSPEDFRSLANEVADTDLSDFFSAAIDSTAELNYDHALEYLGIKLSRPGDAENDEKSDDSDDEPGWLGIEMKNGIVRAVKRGTPGFNAAINVGDELLAIDGYRITDLTTILKKFEPGQRVSLTLSRRGKLRELTAELGKKPDKAWVISVREERLDTQKLRYQRWIAEYENL